jgi:hypothetical protein
VVALVFATNTIGHSHHFVFLGRFHISFFFFLPFFSVFQVELVPVDTIPQFVTPYERSAQLLLLRITASTDPPAP